ncbi:hypothetical protein D1BOALGB6SA_8937 [Olavius sp. associated proteobacterium Delta 1]|nr:hypothetical protein D1BOALGB6SA_8937 [Olavius sp. associated proteobacterium Delta 1]
MRRVTQHLLMEDNRKIRKHIGGMTLRITSSALFGAIIINFIYNKRFDVVTWFMKTTFPLSLNLNTPTISINFNYCRLRQSRELNL